MSDRDSKPAKSTVPPPSGADDAYSASTVVGQASAELLALVRAADEGTLDAKLAENAAAAKEVASLDAMKEAALRAAKQAAANEGARNAAKAAERSVPAPRPASAAPERSVPAPRPASAAPPAAPVATAKAPSVPPPAPTADAPAPAARARTVSTPPEERSRRQSARGETETTARRLLRQEQPKPSAGLPPAVAIVLWFVAVALVLAALVR